MAVQRYTNVIIRAGVDEAQKIFLALSQSRFRIRASTICVLICSVDQDSISGRRWATFLNILVRYSANLKRSLVIPVVHHVRTKVFQLHQRERTQRAGKILTNIIVGRGRPVDDDWSHDTIPILGREVTVIPSRPELSAFEGVCL